MKERFIKVIKNSSIIIVIGIGYAEICKRTGFGIPCIFREVTGYRCPSCGITHMFIHLLHFNFKAAYLENQVVFILMPVFLITICYHIFQYVKYGKAKIGKVENYLCYVLIGILAIWGVARNLV